jgi:alpha/beta superfamily hydrolase
MHNKVVYRAVQALTRSGYATLRFNFRGVGVSEGRYDGGRGEIDDYRAAMAEAVREGGLPLVAGGFSFGSAVGLRAIARDEEPRAAAFVALGLPLATESGRLLPRPAIPALYVAGERDAFGPPEARALRRGRGDRRDRAGVGHFFEGSLESLGGIIEGFLTALPAERGRRFRTARVSRACRQARGATCSNSRAGRWRPTFAVNRRRASPRTAPRPSERRAASSSRSARTAHCRAASAPSRRRAT